MKICTYCGAKYPDEATVCALDGYALRTDDPATANPIAAAYNPNSNRQQIIDTEHLKLLALFNFVVAGLAVCGLCFLFLHFLIMHTLVLNNPAIWKTRAGAPAPNPELIRFIFGMFYLIIGGMIFTAGILNLLGGIFLRQRRHRIFCFVVAVINCVQFPFGTILGVFTMLVLSRSSVRPLFSDV